ncbi:hypothetical protein POM88_014426 [Heracleum sosnowskyi]|uniref:Prolamin-like domain-containing protein n=1 Tax=Heracleum sosnowskyi TaxID=360622 RepID=A0AAD8MYZ0_9APIA|nr:hypothetical protein POM88_014426 [Heracleum sosnowskyi]
MATKSTNMSLMVIFFSFSFLIFAPSQLVFSYENKNFLSAPTPSPSSENRDKLLPELKKFVAKCGEKLSNHCGEEIRNDLLEIENISGYCCKQLVEMGKICHLGMVRLAATTSVNKEEASTIVSNSARVYNKCARVINSIASSPH